MSSDYLSPQQLQQFYPGLTPPRLARWRWAKTGPAYSKIGRQVLYRRDVIEKFLAQNEVAQ